MAGRLIIVSQELATALLDAQVANQELAELESLQGKPMGDPDLYEFALRAARARAADAAAEVERVQIRKLN